MSADFRGGKVFMVPLLINFHKKEVTYIIYQKSRKRKIFVNKLQHRHEQKMVVLKLTQVVLIF